MMGAHGISIDILERAAARGWQAPEVESLGEWQLRAADGFTGRANSALAIGDPGLPLGLAIDRVRGWYEVRRQRPMVAVAYPLGRPSESELDEFLAGQGWTVDHGAIVMTADAGVVAGVLRVGGAGRAGGLGGEARVAVQDAPDEGWLGLYRHRGQVPPPISRRLLTSAPWQAFASVRDRAGTVAVGRVAVSDGWAGLTAVEVHPDHRRRGLGVVLTVALAQAALDIGVSALYLQVEAGNAAARRLYEGCGFTDHHGYHFRTSPSPAV